MRELEEEREGKRERERERERTIKWRETGRETDKVWGGRDNEREGGE